MNKTTPAGPSPHLQVALAAMLFSTGGAAIKAAEAAPAVIAAGRSAVAAVIVLLLLAEARRRPSLRTLAVAFAYAATLMLFVFSNKLTTAAAAIFLQSTSPFWVALLSPLLLRESVPRRDLLALPVLLACMVLIFLGHDEASVTATRPLLGNLLALIAGLSFGFVLLGLRGLSRHEGQGALAAMAWGNLMVVVLCLPALAGWFGGTPSGGAVTGSAFAFGELSLRTVLVIVYLGTVQVGLAYWLLARAARCLPALEVSLLLLLEPALSPCWAFFFHGERPGWPTLLGGAGILTISVAKLVTSRRVRSP